MKKSEIPILKGYISGNQIFVYCPYCKKFHIHGAGDEEKAGKKTLRSSHCTAEPNNFDGYYVQRFNKKECKELIKNLSK